MTGVQTCALPISFGPVAPTTLPAFVTRSIITVMLFLAYELGYWLNHYLSHRVPFLWEFHRVHHTATVLTPVTNFRVHPVYTFVFVNILAVSTAIANGIGNYMFGETAYQYALSDTNIILVIFIHTYVHLQHTELWVPLSAVLGRVFMSPAHHQVRSMVGSLVLVGEGKWSADDLAATLAARSRAACGPVAPPEGLYLVGVEY